MCSKYWTNTNQYSSVWTESQPNNHITSILWYYLSREQQEAVVIPLIAHSSELASKHHLEGAERRGRWQTASRTNSLWAPWAQIRGKRGTEDRGTRSLPAQTAHGIRKPCCTLLFCVMEKGIGGRQEQRWGGQRPEETWIMPGIMETRSRCLNQDKWTLASPKVGVLLSLCLFFFFFAIFTSLWHFYFSREDKKIVREKVHVTLFFKQKSECTPRAMLSRPCAPCPFLPVFQEPALFTWDMRGRDSHQTFQDCIKCIFSKFVLEEQLFRGSQNIALFSSLFSHSIIIICLRFVTLWLPLLTEMSTSL